jgi:signal transduction histidine kinase
VHLGILQADFTLLMKGFFCCLILLVLFMPKASFGQYSFQSIAGGQVIAKKLSFYIDSSGKKDINEIQASYATKQFSALSKNDYQTGYRNVVHWIALDVANNSNQQQSLMYEVTDPSIDELELFEVNEGGTKSLGLTGDIFPFSKRAVPDKNFVFPISIPANTQYQYFLRINSHGHTSYLQVKVQPEPVFRQASKRGYLFWGVLFGVMLFVAVFSLFIFISLRDRLYLFYVLYVISVLFWMLGNNGIGYQYFWSNYPVFNGLVRFISGSFSIIMILTIMQSFLGQTKQNSRFYGFTNLLKWSLGIMIFLPLIPYDYTSNEKLQAIFLVIADIISLCCLISLYGSSIEKIRQGVKLAYYYLIAVTCVALGGTCVLLLRLSLLAVNEFTLTMPYLGIVVEIVVLTFGLTVRYNNYKKEREKLMLEMQEQEKEAAIKLALAKEEERRRIAADMHDDLGAGLSGLKLMSELATRKSTADELKKETQRIASSASDLSEKMRDIIWTLNAENDTLQKLLFYIHHYGDQLFETAEISFNMQLPTQIPVCNISGDWRRHVFLAVKEAFNNIIKHAHATAVLCTVEISNELTIQVKDNGKGLTTNGKGMGNGLANMHQRMKEVQGKLEISSDQGMSLLFKVPLPNP